MPTRPPADDSEPWPFAADVLRRLDDVERRIIRVPEGEDTILQVYEDGEPLGDVRHLDFGPGVLAEKLNADWARVTGQAAGGGGSWATVTVAAVDSHQKAKDEADFVCTGVNDEVMLLAALTELKLRCTLPSTAVTYGKMGLYQGTYYLKDTFSNYVGGPNNVPIWLQGMGVGTEIRADTGFLGTHLISLGTTNIGRTHISDMSLNCANLAANGLAMGGPFSPNPSTHRQFVWNLLVQNFSAYGIFGQGGVGPATFIDNVETIGGVIGIYTDGSNPTRVTNCRARSATSYGILSRGLVQGCIVDNCDTGIAMSDGGVDAGTGGRCVDNWITGGDVGISAAGNDNVVANNVVVATGEYGILVGDDRQIIADNIVKDCGTDGTFDGIRITGDECSVWNNKVRGCTDYGISVQASATGTYIAFNDLELNTTGTIEDLGTGTVIYPQAGGEAPATADYLVGTAQAGLSAEIVVGTTPGGELGGTWASPAVDATHSGSTHTDFIAKALVDAKGDVITATADNTPVRKAVGADGTALVASAAAGDGLVWGTPAVLNFAAATTLETVVGKVEIFDGAGVSLGFLPVYDAIT